MPLFSIPSIYIVLRCYAVQCTRGDGAAAVFPTGLTFILHVDSPSVPPPLHHPPAHPRPICFLLSTRADSSDT